MGCRKTGQVPEPKKDPIGLWFSETTSPGEKRGSRMGGSCSPTFPQRRLFLSLSAYHEHRLLMADRKNLPPEILARIAKELNVPMRGLAAVIELLGEGGTVPFIARYRKEATGNLDEVQIRAIAETLPYSCDRVARRET